MYADKRKPRPRSLPTDIAAQRSARPRRRLTQRRARVTVSAG
jgi:hypothetical protein